MALITCKDLTLGYDSHAILEHLSFQVNPGDYLCIVGENGSGKSTLMRTVLGLQRPMAGTISFGDGLRENEIGYLPQQTAIQKDFPATVWEIVLSGCQAHMGRRAFYGKPEKALAAQSLDEPVSGLDPRVTAEMYALIERLNREGVTVIMISHDLGAATRYATHILHLGGATVFFGTARQYADSAMGRRFDVAEGGAGA